SIDMRRPNSGDGLDIKQNTAARGVEEMKSVFKNCLAAGLLAAFPGLALAQTGTVKLGQIEAQTGPNAIYGYMPSQGVPIAVDEINKAGGFKVGDTTYKLDLIALDTRATRKRRPSISRSCSSRTRSSSC